ncbi:conserved protein, unknown function, partial [Hepatocystis sp. ex Piliocolobus tephrosceles]
KNSDKNGEKNSDKNGEKNSDKNGEKNSDKNGQTNSNYNKKMLSKKDTKQIISELKNTLNIVDNDKPVETKKIDGLSPEEIKTLDCWYFANKLKIVSRLFENNTLNADLLNALYFSDPGFKHKKSKIIIYLNYIKTNYDKSIKNSNIKKNEIIQKENIKRNFIKQLDNSIDNLKEKNYMKKIITIIKNEINYFNITCYFEFLSNVSFNIYDVFIEQQGIECIKFILENMAKKKIIKNYILLLQHILLFLDKLNITIEHLKNTFIGIPINFIAKNKTDVKNMLDYTHDNKNIELIATNLINKWKSIRDKAVIGSKQTVDKQAVDKQAVDKQAVDKQAVDKQTVDKQAVDKQAVDKQTVDKQAMDKQTVDKQTVNKNVINDEKNILNNVKDTYTNINKNICETMLQITDKTNSFQVPMEHINDNIGGITEQNKNQVDQYHICTENKTNLYNIQIDTVDKRRKLFDEEIISDYPSDVNKNGKGNNKNKKTKNLNNTGETKNIMLEIIGTLNEEHEKKK